MIKEEKPISEVLEAETVQVVTDKELPVHVQANECFDWMTSELSAVEGQTHAYVRGRHPKGFRAVETSMNVFRETARAASVMAHRFVADACFHWQKTMENKWVNRRVTWYVIGSVTVTLLNWLITTQVVS